jgi:hypothetical protein
MLPKLQALFDGVFLEHGIGGGTAGVGLFPLSLFAATDLRSARVVHRRSIFAAKNAAFCPKTGTLERSQALGLLLRLLRSKHSPHPSP